MMVDRYELTSRVGMVAYLAVIAVAAIAIVLAFT
jgi:hypothetical protein